MNTLRLVKDLAGGMRLRKEVQPNFLAEDITRVCMENNGKLLILATEKLNEYRKNLEAELESDELTKHTTVDIGKVLEALKPISDGSPAAEEMFDEVSRARHKTLRKKYERFLGKAGTDVGDKTYAAGILGDLAKGAILSRANFMTPQQVLFFSALIVQYFHFHPQLKLVWMNILQFLGRSKEDGYSMQADKGLAEIISQSFPENNFVSRVLLHKNTKIYSASLGYTIIPEDLGFYQQDLEGLKHISQTQFDAGDDAKWGFAANVGSQGMSVVLKILKPHAVVFMLLECSFMLDVVVRDLKIAYFDHKKDLERLQKPRTRTEGSNADEIRRKMLNLRQTIKLVYYITKEFIKETDFVNEMKGNLIACNSFPDKKQNLGVPLPLAVSSGGEVNKGLQWIVLERVGEETLKSVLDKARGVLRSKAGLQQRLQAQRVLRSLAQTVAVIRGKFLSNALAKTKLEEHIIWADGHIGNMMTNSYATLVGFVEGKNPVPNAPIWLIDFGSWGSFLNNKQKTQNLQKGLVRISVAATFHETFVEGFKRSYESAYDKVEQRSRKIWLLQRLEDFLATKVKDLTDNARAAFLSHVGVAAGPILTKIIQQLNAPKQDINDETYSKRMQLVVRPGSGMNENTTVDLNVIREMSGYSAATDDEFVSFVVKHFRIREQDNPTQFMKTMFVYHTYDTPKKRADFVKIVQDNMKIARTTIINVMRLCNVDQSDKSVLTVLQSLNVYNKEDFDFGKIFIKVAELVDIGTCTRNDILLFGRGASILLGSVNRMYELVRDDELLGKAAYEKMVVQAVAKKYPGYLVWLAMKGELKLKINQAISEDTFFKKELIF